MLHAPSTERRSLSTRARLGGLDPRGTIPPTQAAGPTRRWLMIALFAYFIFSPVLGIIPRMEQPAVIVVLWLIIGAPTRVASPLTATREGRGTRSDGLSP